MGSIFSSTQTSKPPAYVNKILKTVGGIANDALKNGGGAYNGSLVTPFSKQTKTGMRSLMDTSRAAQNGGYSDFFTDLMNSGGLTDGQSQVTDSMRGIANSGLMNDLINNGTGLTAAQQRALGLSESSGNKIGAHADAIAANGGLTGDQQGAMDRWRTQLDTPFSLDNPGYSEVRKNALADQSDALTARAVAMGRYGSGADQSILAREQGRLGAALDNAEFVRQENQDDQAAASLFGGGQTAQTNIPNLYGATQDAAGKTAGISQQGVSNNLSAISAKSALENAMFNMEQARLGNTSTAFEALQAPAKTAMGVGAMNEAKYAEMLQDRLRMAQQPLDLLSRYAGMFNGAPIGQSSYTTPGIGQVGLGGLLALSSLWGGSSPGGSAGAV